MKTLKIFSTAILVLLFAQLSFAQKIATETLNVSGECGMCKKKIEKAAKDAGATYAVWSTQTKVLTVRYNSLSTNLAKIQQKIAGVGYDTPDYKATDEAYNKLDKCCQYDRDAANKEMNCCGSNCEMKDGKCADEAACKEKGCCKDSEKCKEMGCCGSDMAANSKTMDCCKKDANGKMSMNCSNDCKDSKGAKGSKSSSIKKTQQ
jgi:hypothetical protein